MVSESAAGAGIAGVQVAAGAGIAGVQVDVGAGIADAGIAGAHVAAAAGAVAVAVAAAAADAAAVDLRPASGTALVLCCFAPVAAPSALFALQLALLTASFLR